MRRIGPGLGFSRRRAAVAASYTAEATAYFAAMSVQPDNTRKSALNNLIASLKTAGVWAKLDWLSVHAAHDEQAARVNAVNPAQVASVGVAPTFTTDRGHTGNGSTQYLNTGWNPTTASSPKFAQNDCHMGVWVGTDATSGAQYELGNSNAGINARNSSALAVVAQAASVSSGLTIATAVGHSSWTRTSSTAGVIYRNAVSLGAISTTSTALRNASFLIGGQNSSSTGTVTLSSASTRRVQAVHWGQGLSGAETTALYNALATYMTAVGA